MPRVLAVRAPAKVNLELRILGIRPDGFHELSTVFQSIDLHDALTFTLRPGPFTIRCDAPGLPADRSNLVWRAAEAVSVALGRGEVCDLEATLDKRIPSQAGLGGGSSDAAATIRALTSLWNAELSDDAHQQIARALGADVPYFQVGGTALGAGRGDEIQPLDNWPPHTVLLVVPDFGISTSDAYRRYDEAADAADGSPSAVVSGFSRTIETLHNDFEPAVFARFPQLAVIKASLLRLGASAALMSGSGSTIFGLFDKPEVAAMAAIEMAGQGYRTIRTSTVTAAEYKRLAAPFEGCL